VKPEDFEEMSWRLDLIREEESIFDLYPDLIKRFDGMQGISLTGINVLNSITNEQLIKFIVYCYHKNSPFVRKITEVKHRKSQALIQVGCKFAEGIPEDIQEVINCKNQTVADMILKFLLGENNLKFSALMMQTDAYYKYNYKLAYEETTNLKGLMGAVNELFDSIQNLSHDVFSGDREMANFVAGAGVRGLTITPEQNAHRKK
jgi:hypothetical protein